MESLALCRTCGENIYILNAKNLFEQKNSEMLDKIATLTGIWLDDDEDMPKHICACCYLDLNHSIAFRERCIKIQKLLQSEGGVPRDAAALDPLKTQTNLRIPTSQMNSNKKQQRTIVRELTEPYYFHATSHCAQPRSSKQQLSINETADALVPGQHTKSDVKHVVKVVHAHKKHSPAERDKNIKISSTAAKNSTVMKNSRTVIDVVMHAEEEDYNRSKSKPNMRRSGVDKTYVCDQCGKCFTDPSNLKVHILRHTGIKNFECDECGTKYFTRHLLNLHIRVRHQGEMPYACKYCDQRFYTSTARCRHERVKHTRKSSYVCRLCGKTYLTKSCLNKHEFLHTGERPYRCEICNVGFPRNTNLKIHYRSKQHQKRASDALDKQFPIIDPISDEDTDIDSIIEEVDV